MKSNLNKMKMPKKQDEFEMESMSEESPEESSEFEFSEEEGGGPSEEEGSEAPSDLEMFSDEDLMAEMKKRGLMSDLEGSENPSKESPPEEEMY